VENLKRAAAEQSERAVTAWRLENHTARLEALEIENRRRAEAAQNWPVTAPSRQSEFSPGPPVAVAGR
jgi:hypothetical protein